MLRNISCQIGDMNFALEYKILYELNGLAVIQGMIQIGYEVYFYCELPEGQGLITFLPHNMDSVIRDAILRAINEHEHLV